MYKIIIKSRAEKEFAKLPEEFKKKFYEEFRKLSVSPFGHPKINPAPFVSYLKRIT